MPPPPCHVVTACALASAMSTMQRANSRDYGIFDIAHFDELPETYARFDCCRIFTIYHYYRAVLSFRQEIANVFERASILLDSATFTPNA